MKKFLKEEFITEIETDDSLGSIPPFVQETSDGYYEYNEIEYSKEVTWKDCASMDIFDAKKILENLIFEGANRVYIIAHNDHGSYIFTGVKLREKTSLESIKQKLSKEEIEFLKEKGLKV